MSWWLWLWIGFTVGYLIAVWQSRDEDETRWTIDLYDRELQVVVTDEGVIFDVIRGGVVVETLGCTYEEWADWIEM